MFSYETYLMDWTVSAHLTNAASKSPAPAPAVSSVSGSAVGLGRLRLRELFLVLCGSNDANDDDVEGGSGGQHVASELSA